jgi:hypothetical protein
LTKASKLSEQRSFITPEPGEDWNALAARALPNEPVESAIQSLRSWNLHLMARTPPGEFLGCDVLFIEPPHNREPNAFFDMSAMDSAESG